MEVDVSLRTNIDYLFTMRENILTNRQKLFKYYFGQFAKFDEFDKVMTACTKDARPTCSTAPSPPPPTPRTASCGTGRQVGDHSASANPRWSWAKPASRGRRAAGAAAPVRDRVRLHGAERLGRRRPLELAPTGRKSPASCSRTRNKFPVARPKRWRRCSSPTSCGACGRPPPKPVRRMSRSRRRRVAFACAVACAVACARARIVALVRRDRGATSGHSSSSLRARSPAYSHPGPPPEERPWKHPEEDPPARFTEERPWKRRRRSTIRRSRRRVAQDVRTRLTAVPPPARRDESFAGERRVPLLARLHTVGPRHRVDAQGKPVARDPVEEFGVVEQRRYVERRHRRRRSSRSARSVSLQNHTVETSMLLLAWYQVDSSTIFFLFRRSSSSKTKHVLRAREHSRQRCAQGADDAACAGGTPSDTGASTRARRGTVDRLWKGVHDRSPDVRASVRRAKAARETRRALRRKVTNGPDSREFDASVAVGHEPQPVSSRNSRRARRRASRRARCRRRDYIQHPRSRSCTTSTCPRGVIARTRRQTPRMRSCTTRQRFTRILRCARAVEHRGICFTERAARTRRRARRTSSTWCTDTTSGTQGGRRRARCSTGSRPVRDPAERGAHRRTLRPQMEREGGTRHRSSRTATITT